MSYGHNSLPSDFVPVVEDYVPIVERVLGLAARLSLYAELVMCYP